MTGRPDRDRAPVAGGLGQERGGAKAAAGRHPHVR
jgi:hypothetical protein